MNLAWKKIGIIIFFVLTVCLFAFFLYWFFYRPIFVPANPNGNNATSTAGQLPDAGTGGIRNTVSSTAGQLPSGNNINNTATNNSITPSGQKENTAIASLTNEPAYFSTLDSNGNVIYYSSSDGKFHTIGRNNEISDYNSAVFYNVQNVTWSGERNKAVLEYPDGSNILYDFTTNKQITLPKHWQEFNFSPTDQQLVFKSMGLDKENRFLAIANENGTGARAIENIGGVEDEFTVNWSPNNQIVATVAKGKDLNRSEIYFVGQNSENFKSIIVEGRDFQGKWTADGSKIVYSVYDPSNNYLPTLWITDTNGDNIGANRKQLNINTWMDKCSFSGKDKLYCAVPTSLPYGAGLDRTITNTIADQIYEIDLTTGAKKPIANTNNQSISQIIAPENSDYLIYTDTNTGRAYKLQLP